MSKDTEENSALPIENVKKIKVSSSKEEILALIDNVEMLVEKFRRDSQVLEERSEELFSKLEAIKHHELLKELESDDKAEVESYIERVLTRCTTVEIVVRTERDTAQEEALLQVNALINSLVASFKHNPVATRSKCLAYMAACTSVSDDEPDKTFESALLGCTLDDQKKIKKRLGGIFSYLNESSKGLLLNK